MTINVTIKPDNKINNKPDNKEGSTKERSGQAASGGLSSQSDVKINVKINSDNKELTPAEKSICLYLMTHPTTTQAQIAAELGIGASSVGNHISRLQAKGYLQRVGSRKKGSWIVLNPEELGL